MAHRVVSANQQLSQRIRVLALHTCALDPAVMGTLPASGDRASSTQLRWDASQASLSWPARVGLWR